MPSERYLFVLLGVSVMLLTVSALKFQWVQVAGIKNKNRFNALIFIIMVIAALLFFI